MKRGLEISTFEYRPMGRDTEARACGRIHLSGDSVEGSFEVKLLKAEREQLDAVAALVIERVKARLAQEVNKGDSA
jgi:hypothetical protein